MIFLSPPRLEQTFPLFRGFCLLFSIRLACHRWIEQTFSPFPLFCLLEVCDITLAAPIPTNISVISGILFAFFNSLSLSQPPPTNNFPIFAVLFAFFNSLSLSQVDRANIFPKLGVLFARSMWYYSRRPGWSKHFRYIGDFVCSRYVIFLSPPRFRQTFLLFRGFCLLFSIHPACHSLPRQTFSRFSLFCLLEVCDISLPSPIPPNLCVISGLLFAFFNSSGLSWVDRANIFPIFTVLFARGMWYFSPRPDWSKHFRYFGDFVCFF